MKFLFIDETEQLGYFGVSLIWMDSTKYSSIRKNILDSITGGNWSIDLEFKADCIFSSKKGDKSVTIEDREKIATKIIKSNVSNSNAKIKCFFAYRKGKKDVEGYKKLLEEILSKIPKANNAKLGKNLVVVFFDQLGFGKKDKEKIFSALRRSLLYKKKYAITEHPVEVSSSNQTPGILLADQVAFICMWYSLNDKVKDKEETDIKRQKNEYIKSLVSQLKHVKIMKLVE